MYSIYLEGFLLQVSLIFALGAQNIFVLESGLRRHRPLWVAAVCSICDTLLLAIGVMGAGSVFIQYPIIKITFGVVGVSFLAYYAFLKLRETPEPLDLSSGVKQARDLRGVIFQSMGFSFLNPHALLDTIVLVGGFSTRYSELSERAWFGAGAASFSTVWFFGLALASRAMSGLFSHPRAMRAVSLVSGMILLFLAVKLGADVWGWATD